MDVFHTIGEAIAFILQFSFGAILGVIVWHKAPVAFRFLQAVWANRPKAIAAPRPGDATATEFKITGPHLDSWPIDRAWLNRYGIRTTTTVYDAKRLTLPLSTLSALPPEAQEVVKGLHAEGRAPGPDISGFVGRGESFPAGLGLALVLCQGQSAQPDTWLIPVPVKQG